jgi:hypothetical protein
MSDSISPDSFYRIQGSIMYILIYLLVDFLVKYIGI